LDYENFCSQILKTDPKIRFASVYDQWAKHVGGGMREGVKSLLSEHMENELLNLSIIAWKARKDAAKMLGKTKLCDKRSSLIYSCHIFCLGIGMKFEFSDPRCGHCVELEKNKVDKPCECICHTKDNPFVRYHEIDDWFFNISILTAK